MLRLLTALTVVAAVLASGPQASAEGCAGEAAGGDWTMYGHDLSNTRTQPAEDSIDAVKAAALAPAFVVTVASFASGSVNSTPVIAGGCIYAATDSGWVFALNADDGSEVWKTRYLVEQTRLGGTITGAVAVSGGLAYVHVSDAGKPFVAALDALSGEEVWRTVVDTRPGSFSNSSPVLFDGLVFTGFSGDEYVDEARGGYAIIDAATGALLAHHYVIPDEDFLNGSWGASIWATGVVDPDTKMLFVGTGNPNSHDTEHAYANAILKIDLDRSSPAFGTIVASYKGTVEQYFPGLDEQPVCDLEPDVEYGDAWSLTCLQLDVDFGASPNLFRDADGDLIVGGFQKSGIYHAVRTDDMSQAWTALVGTPCFACNAASPAADASGVHVAAVEPGQVVSLGRDDGSYRWIHPLADLFHYQSVSAANGLVYVLDLYGTLSILDSATGAVVAKRNLSLDTGVSASGITSGGAAIARNTVYVGSGPVIVAYR